MLTKSDLSQIRKVVREEVETESKQIQADIMMSRMRLQADIDGLKDRVKNVEIAINNMQTGMDRVEKKLTKMHRDLKNEIKLVSHVLDKQGMGTIKRVRRIEEHLGLQAPSQ